MKNTERKSVKLTPLIKEFLKERQFSEYRETGKQPSQAELIERAIEVYKKSEGDLVDSASNSTGTVVSSQTLVRNLTEVKTKILKVVEVLDHKIDTYKGPVIDASVTTNSDPDTATAERLLQESEKTERNSDGDAGDIPPLRGSSNKKIAGG